MISIVHVALAAAAWLALWRSLERTTVVANAPDPQVASALALGVLLASGVGSLAAIVSGRRGSSPRRALAADAVSFAAAAWLLAVVSLGPWTRDLGGIALVLVVISRLAPGAIAVVSGRAPAWLAFVVALGAYAALASWLPVASLPFGDQIHYLLVADRLAHGSLDATIDVRLFAEILGTSPSPTDAAVHVAPTPLGARPVQGYLLPLLLVPGWAILGRLGAGLVIALVAAWTSYQILLILRDVGGALTPLRPPRGAIETSPAARLPERAIGWTWLIATACAPLSLLATHIYPNVLGAALVATAYRSGFTAPVRRPALAAALLAATLFLTPRDAIALLVLLPLLARDPLRRIRVVAATAAVLVASVVVDAVLYGLPIPFAGYAFGAAQAQEVTREPSITLFVWVTLPAILFDRTFGLAGSAPWAFVGLIGLLPALRADRARLLPAAVAFGATVVALAFVRLWEGGYAPPARYLVDVLPLCVPFVAYGLAVAAGWIARAAVGLLVGMSAVTAVVLNAVPTLALNTAFDDKIRYALARVLGLDPLAWLPSFQPVVPNWYVIAYLTLLPAVAGATGLFWLGARLASWKGTQRAADRGDPFERGLPDLNGSGPVLNRSGSTPEERETRSLSLAGPWSSSGRRVLLFLVVNLVAIAWVVIATLQPWIASASDPVPESLLRKWLPLSLAFAALGTALVARALAPAKRAPVYARHFLVYLVPLLLLLVAQLGGPGVLNGQLGAIHLLIAVGFAVHALAALWPALDRMTDRAAALRLSAVALIAMLILLPYHRAVMPTASDEPHYLIVTQSLVYDRDLDVRNDYEGDRYRAYYPTRLPDMHGVEVGRAVYSVRDLGMPILSAVPFAIAGRLGVLAFMCVVGAALVAQLYLLLRDLAFAPRVAFLATATTALVHPLFTYTTQVYPELLTALAFVTAVRVIRRGGRSTLRELAIASAFVGTLPWLSTRAWPIVVGVGLVVAYCALRPTAPAGRASVLARRIAAGALPFAALVLVLAFVNWRTFGLFLPSAGYFLIREQQPVLVYTFWIGGPGLLFDRVFGLIPRAPIYLLAFLGAFALWRRARTGHGVEIAALAAGAVLSFVYIADIAYWWADGSPPSRYMIGSLPLLVPAVAAGWENVLHRPRAPAALSWASALAWAATVMSAAVAYVFAVLPNIRYDLALDVRASGSSGALFAFLQRAAGLDAGPIFPSLVRVDPASVALTAAWLAFAAGLVIAGGRTTRSMT